MKIKILTITSAIWGLVGCASNHHLVFFTNTTIGVEIGSEPANGSPAKFIVGYKRQEGVIDPLIPDYEFIGNTTNIASLNTLTEPVNGDTNIVMSPQGTAIPKGHKTNAHSVLAKMNFGATGGGSGASAAQFFATGRAAELLAESDGITSALAGDSKISSNKTLEFGNGDISFGAHLQQVYNFLVNYANSSGKKTSEAIALINKVDALDEGMFKKTFKHYTSSALSTDVGLSDYSISSVKSFSNVIPYTVAMNNALETAKLKILDPNSTNAGAPITLAEKKEMLNNIESYPDRIKETQEAISSSPAVISMVDFVYKNILLKSEDK